MNILYDPDWNKAKPHTVLDALCLQCGYYWTAVIPVGTQPTECPNCGKHPYIEIAPSNELIDNAEL